jgi:hypothetical protein
VSRATYEDTRDLVGQELVDALGLQPLDVPRGEWLEEDDPRLGDCGAPARGESAPEGAATVSIEGKVYCLGGVASDDFEAWDLASRLGGHVPCDAEVEAFRLLEAAEAASEAGDEELERELDLRRHEVLEEARSDPSC